MLRPALFFAFFFSGCSGLIYQTVWVRMLIRYVGATSYATATVLAVFMAGLAIGAYLGGRYAERGRRPLLAYGLLEVLIAATGLLASFVVIQGLSTYYISFFDTFGNTPSAILLTRILFIVGCLLPPTVLMGATLPILVEFISRLGEHLQLGLAKLYTINTFGAVAGVLVAGVFLIGEFGETTSLWVAASLNLVAALLVFGMRGLPSGPVAARIQRSAPAESSQTYAPTVRRIAVAAFMVSGFSALAYEIFWTRYLVLFLHTSIYAFSAMLGTFLAGITLGSLVAARRGQRGSPIVSFGMLEILIGVWTVVGLLLLPWSNDIWLVVRTRSDGGMMRVLVGALTCIIMVMPVAFMFGLQFPIAVRCCQRPTDAAGRTTGWAYAANTLGTILGALSASFLLIPLFGTAKAMVFVAALNIVFGILLLLAAPTAERRGRFIPAAFWTVVFAGLAVFSGDPYASIMTARLKSNGAGWEVFRSYESATANTISGGDRAKPLDRTLVVSGTGMTGLCNETKLMAHLPLLLAENPRSLLVICFGMGTTFRSACHYPDLTVDAVDIVPEVLDCFPDFHPDAAHWTSQPNAHTHVDDGRHYLLIHPQKYDVITIDPAPPLHSAGTVNLYTKEFFQLCKNRLTPGGVLSVWLPGTAESEILIVMRSFLEVFPEMSLWGALEFPGFYLIGGHRPLQQTTEQVAEVARKLSQIEDMKEWKIKIDYSQPKDLEKLYLTDAVGLSRFVEGIRPVTDDHPYTEFPLWRRVLHPEHHGPFSADTFREWLNAPRQDKIGDDEPVSSIPVPPPQPAERTVPRAPASVAAEPSPAAAAVRAPAPAQSSAARRNGKSAQFCSRPCGTVAAEVRSKKRTAIKEDSQMRGIRIVSVFALCCWGAAILAQAPEDATERAAIDGWVNGKKVHPEAKFVEPGVEAAAKSVAASNLTDFLNPGQAIENKVWEKEVAAGIENKRPHLRIRLGNWGRVESKLNGKKATLNLSEVVFFEPTANGPVCLWARNGDKYYFANQISGHEDLVKWLAKVQRP